MPLIAIINPVCGNSTAVEFFERNVVPFLEQSGLSIDKSVVTKDAAHAGSALVDFLRDVDDGADGLTQVTVILGSGDGTLHDIINHFAAASHPRLPQLEFVLVPCGTANALYSSFFPPRGVDVTESGYRLQSLRKFVEKKRAVPLTFAHTVLFGPQVESTPRTSHTIIGTVVVSSTLHAAILRDSEGLRATMPGIERFKVAAEKNIHEWCNATVKLRPLSSGGRVQRYAPTSLKLVPVDEEGSLSLEGPFSYFLSSVNVDRLEPAFRITPLSADSPSNSASCDVVIIRPLRDPRLSRDDAASRTAFVPIVWKTVSHAYQNGQHINLRYGDAGEVVSEGSGESVVEYFRCGGWEWTPGESDRGAHLLCVDGTVVDINDGGYVECTATQTESTSRFLIFA